ncbi:TonB-dependent receptor [Novosphingobium sp. PY1]|nr:TonB-dependent receptor [Novosphingobium sp. PY1]
MSLNVRTFLLAGVAGIAFASPAVAQEAGSRDGLNEIVVTAQKREESLQDVPVSIVALGLQDLENKGISDLTDLRTQVPALQVTPHPNSAITARIFMRGVGNNDDQITMDPSVAVYIDGVYVARSQGLASDVAELERVEVLRGPQGSLYGRNATGGAINFITRAPKLGEFGAEQKLTYGNYDQFRSRTRVNVPIGDTLAVEFGYLHAQMDGYVDNLGTGVKRFGDQRRDGYRAAALWQPTDAISVRYTYDRSEINDTPAFIAYVPFYPEVAPRPTAGSPSVSNLQPNDVVSQGHNLTASWDVSDSLTVKSITGYRKLRNQTMQDYHSGIFGPFPVFRTAFDSSQKQFSEELQLIGSGLDDRLEYVLGFYYFEESADSFDTTVVPGRPRSERTVTIDNKAYAVYAQATYNPAFLDNRLFVTLGGRWSRDERKATLQDVAVPSVGDPIPGTPGRGDRAFQNFSPSATLRYEFSDKTNAYAKVVSGYKTGGYNVRASTTDRFNAGFGDETLTSYEFGVKSDMLDNRLRLNAAFFYTSYKDIQLNVQSDPNNIARTDVLNAGKATIKGLELDLSLRPARGLTVSANYAYLDAKYDRILNAAGDDVTSQYNYIQAPNHTLVTSVNYEFPPSPIGTFAVYADYFLQDKKMTSSTDSRYIVGSYGLLNGRVTLSDIPVGFGNWQLAVFGRNLTDKVYYADHFNAGLPSAFFGQPRTYGVELTFKY